MLVKLYFVGVLVLLPLSAFCSSITPEADPPVNATVKTLTEVFQASGGLVVGLNGDIFVADYGVETIIANGTKVYRVASTGEISVYTDTIKAPTGNVFGPNGLMYQASYIEGSVYSINADGESKVYAKGPELVGPVGVEFNSEGIMFVANCNNNSIAKMTEKGLSVFVSSKQFSCPAGLAFDTKDNLYVTNYGHGIIHKIDSIGNISEFAKAPGGKTKPNGSNAHITFGNGQLYFVNSASHQVYSLSLGGELAVIAGTGEPGRNDGLGQSAQFSLPNGIDISADGSTLYVNDTISIGDDSKIAPNVVRKILLH